MIEKTVAELAAALASGDISSVELTQAYLDRINRHNATLNAFITVCDEPALKQAAAADSARFHIRRSNHPPPLWCFAIVCKDLSQTQKLLKMV